MKDKFATALVNIVKIKSILTLAATAVFVVLSLRGAISPEQFLTIFTTIVGFYFGSQKIKENEGEIVTPSHDTDEYHEN